MNDEFICVLFIVHHSSFIIHHSPMPTDPNPRQTLTFLMRRFKEAGIRPHNKFGQNFLIDLNLLQVLFEAAAVGPRRRGAGSGHGHRLADGAVGPSGRRRGHRGSRSADVPVGRRRTAPLRQRRHAAYRRLEEQESVQSGGARGGPCPVGRRARPAVQDGGQSSLQHRHAGARQSAGRGHAAADHDRDDPEGSWPSGSPPGRAARTTAR